MTPRIPDATGVKLSKPTPIADAILARGVLTREEADRFARHLLRERIYTDLAFELDIAVERTKHEDVRAARARNGKDPYRWTHYPKDPITYPDELPKSVFADSEFEPTCERCRARYNL